MLRELMQRSLWPMSPWARFEGEDGGDGGDGGGGGGGDPVALVDAEGNFSENYLESLPEDIRGEECFKVAGNFTEICKQLVHAQRMTGKEKVALPGENATEEDLAVFYDQIGRPKTVDDYTYTRPEGVPETFRSDEKMADLRKLAHANGYTQRQFDNIMKTGDAQIIAGITNADETRDRETKEAETQLKEDFGMAYEERIHAADVFINTFTREGEHREAYIKEFGRNPMLIKIFSEAGAKLIESDVMIADLTQKAPKEAQQELDELKASEDYRKYERGELETAQHANMQRKVTALFDLIHPAKKTG